MKLTKTFGLLSLALALAAVPGLRGQTTVATTPNPGDFERRAGEREFMLGGAGASNRDFDESFGGVNFAFGSYLNATQAVVLRQSINYANPSGGAGQSWNGSTRVAFDQHLAPRGPLRPFIGANFGGVYGDNVRDTFTAGLELGGKYYVQPRTFVYAMAEYGWFFRRARALDDTFDDGQFNWSLGMGFNF